MSEFKAINTQEEFDAAIGARLERERTSLEKKYAGFDEYKEKAGLYDAELEKGKKSEETIKKLTEDLETATKNTAELKSRAETAEKSLLRAKVASEYKLPYELASRIAGDTEADMKTDAEMLAGFMKPAATAPLFSSTPTGTDNIAAAYGTLLEGLTATAH